MSKEQVTGDRYVCDGCGREVIRLPDDELPAGFHMPTVALIGDFGGDGVEDVWACSEKCIRPAVINSFKNAAEARP